MNVREQLQTLIPHFDVAAADDGRATRAAMDTLLRAQGLSMATIYDRYDDGSAALNIAIRNDRQELLIPAVVVAVLGLQLGAEGAASKIIDFWQREADAGRLQPISTHASTVTRQPGAATMEEMKAMVETALQDLDELKATINNGNGATTNCSPTQDKGLQQ